MPQGYAFINVKHFHCTGVREWGGVALTFGAFDVGKSLEVSLYHKVRMNQQYYLDANKEWHRRIH